MVGEPGKGFRALGSQDEKVYDGADVNAVILDVSIINDADKRGEFYLLSQTRTPKFTSWNAGTFMVQASAHGLGRFGLAPPWLPVVATCALAFASTSATSCCSAGRGRRRWPLAARSGVGVLCS